MPGSSRQFSTDGGNTWTAATAVTNATGTVTGHSFQLESNTSYAPNTIQLKRTDAAGNSSIYIESRTVTIDTVAPAAPSITFADGLGVQTTAGAGVVNIQAESGSKVVVRFSDGSHSLTKTVTGLGASNVPVTLAASDLGNGSAQLQNGTITVSAVATDSAGNASAASTSGFALNSSAPALFVKSGQDRFVNGTEASVDIEVYSTALQTGDVLNFKIDGSGFSGNSKTVSATEATAGKVSFAISRTDLGGDGNKSITATRTPAAGGTAVNSTTTLTLTLDTAAPTPPTLTLDNAVINGATLAEATVSSGVVFVNAESGASVAVTFSDGTRSVIKTVSGQGSSSAVPVTLLGMEIGSLSSQLHEGSISVRAVATDAAGNTSAAGSSSFVLDTIAPGKATLTLDSEVSNNSASLGEATTRLLTLAAELGSTVWLSFSDGVRTVNKAFLVSNASAQVAMLAASDLGTGASQLHDGRIQVYAVVVDAAGNVGGVSSTSFMLDSTPPDTPVLAQGTGVGNGASRDEATRTGAVTVRAESGTSVTVTFADASHSVIKTVTALGPQSAVPVTLAATDFGSGNNQLADGGITVTALATDAAGNPSPAWASTSFTLDTDVPPTPTLTLLPDITGVTNRARAMAGTGVVQVTAITGTQVLVTFSDGTRSITKTLASSGSAQTVSLDPNDMGSLNTNQLHDGGITVTAVALDPADNRSAPATVSFSLDATPPDAPGLALGAGVSGGATRYEALDPNGVILLTAESGSTVELTFADQEAATPDVTKTVTGTGSSQPVVLTADDLVILSEQQIDVTAIATDRARNRGSSNSIRFTLDFTRPTLNISSDKSSLKIGETATINFIFSEVPNGFTSDDIILSGGGTLGTFTGTGKTRTATYTPPPTTNGGVLNISVNAGSYTDSAGNLGYAATMPALRYDTKAPNLLFASVKDQRLTLVFDSDIDPSAWASATTTDINTRFKWLVSKNSGVSFAEIGSAFTNLLVTGSKVQLALATALTNIEDAKIKYVAPTGDHTSNVLQDLAGNDLASVPDRQVFEKPVIIGFAVTDSGHGNGVALGKAGEEVNVLVTFNEPVYFTSAATYRVRVQVGSDSNDFFDAVRKDSIGNSSNLSRSYTFTGKLPTKAGLNTNELQLTLFATIDFAGNLNFIDTVTTVSNGQAVKGQPSPDGYLTQTSYQLTSTAYTVDSLPPPNRINSRTGLLLDTRLGQYATLPAAAAAIDGDMTLEAWAYPIYPGGSQPGSSITLLNLTDAAGSKNITLGLNNDRLTFKAVNAAGVAMEAISTLPIDLNNWNHLAVTVDSSNTLTLYVNGLPVSFSLNGGPAATTATLSGAIPAATRANNTIGAAIPANAFNGIISDLRIYDSSRTPAKIQSDMLGVADPTSAIGYYPFANSPNWYNNPGSTGPATLVNGPGYTTLANLRFSQDTGFSPYDLISNVSKQTITVQLLSALQADEELWVSADDGVNWTTNNVTISNGTATWTDVDLLPPSATGVLPSLQFKVVDAAGNASPIVTQTYMLDTVEPVPNLVLGFERLGLNIPALENGVSGGATRAEATQTSGVLTVTSETGAVVVITFKNSVSPSNTVVKTVTTWTTATPVVLNATDIGNGSGQLHDGVISVSAIATDLAGNKTFIPVTSSFNLDTVAPASQLGRQGLALNARSKQYMALGQPASNFGGDLTVETLFYAKSYDGTIFDFGNDTYNNNLALTLNTTGFLKFTAYDTAATRSSPGTTPFAAVGITATTSVSLNEWHHVAITYSGAGVNAELKLYLDGIFVNTQSVANDNNLANYLQSLQRSNYYVGRSNENAANVSHAAINYFNGMLSDFRVYDNTRTLEQIVSDMQGKMDATDSNLRLYYPFNGSASSGINGGATATPSSDATPPGTNPPGYQVMMSFSKDNGASSTDHITNTTNPGIVGIVTPAPATGEYLYGSVDGGTTWQLIPINGSMFNWNVQLPENSLTPTTYQLRVVDDAGNIGSTFTQTFTIDTIAPAPVITLGAGITASPSTYGATIDEATQATGVLTVAAEAQATVSVTFSDSVTPLSNKIIKNLITSGSATPIPVILVASDIGYGTNQLQDGNITVTTSITDLAGNSPLTSTTTTFKLDTLAPQINFRQALALDATSKQYATMPYLQTSSGNISEDMTLEAWIYINGDLTSDMPIITLNSGATGNGIVLKVSSAGSLFFEAFNGTTQLMSRVTATGIIAPYTWQHVAVAIDKTTSNIAPKLYINGATPSGAISGTLGATKILNVNRTNAYIGYNGSQYFNGSIANVRVYDYERTAAQIATDMLGFVNTADTNLDAYYPLAGNTDSGLTGSARTSAILNSNNTPPLNPVYNTLASLALSNDTAPNGAQNHDFVFRTATQTITVELLRPYETGETFTINGVPYTGPAPKVGESRFILNNYAFTEGTNTLRIKMSDASGNIGPEYTQTYTLDTQAPTNGLFVIRFSNDTAPVGTNTDYVTKVASQTISVQLQSPWQSGDTVWVSTNSGATFQKATATGASTWSLPNATLAAGTGNTLQVKVSDVAGNDGPIATQAYTLDTTAPAIGLLQDTNSRSRKGLALDNSKLQYASLPNAAVAINDDMTLEAWVYAKGNVDGMYIFDSAPSGFTNNRISLSITSGTDAGKLVFLVINQAANSSYSLLSSERLPLNTWVHIAVTVSAAASSQSSYKMYFNGTEKANVQTGSQTTVTNRQRNFVGKSIDSSGTNTSGYFNGLISDLRIFDAERTSTQIAADLLSSVPGPVTSAYMFNGSTDSGKSGVIAATIGNDSPSTTPPSFAQTLTFSNDSGLNSRDLLTQFTSQTITVSLLGTIASDETVIGSVDGGANWVDIKKTSGGSINGTLVTWPTTLVSGTNTIQMKVVDNAGNESTGQALSQTYTKNPVSLNKQNGIALRKSQYVQLPKEAVNLGNTLTLEAWVFVNNATLPAAWVRVFDFATLPNSGAQNNIILSFNPDGKLAFSASYISSMLVAVDLGIVVATTNLDLTQWNHVAVTVTGTDVKLYVNGARADTTGNLTGSLPTLSNNARTAAFVGHSNYPEDSDFNGTISDVQIYRDVRTAQEIASDMVNFISGTNGTDNLIGAYRFNGTLDGAGDQFLAATIPLGVTAPGYFDSMTLSNDTGRSSHDLITKTASQTITASFYGTLGTGEKIWGKWGNATWTDVTSFVSGSQLAWTGQTLASGANTLQLKATDAAGNTAPGTILTQTFTLDITAPTASINNKKALVLDSSKQQYASFTVGNMGNVVGLTIGAWIFVTALPSAPSAIIDLGNSTTGNNIILNLNDNGSINFQVFNGFSSRINITTTKVITLNQWNHVGALITRDQVVYMAINGIESASQGMSYGILPLGGERDSSYIGRRNDNSTPGYFNGMISDVRVYSNQGNVTTDMLGAPPNETNLQVYYPLDNNTNSGKSGGNPATLHSTPANSTPIFAATVSFSADTGTDTHDFITTTRSQKITGILSGTLGTGERLYGSLDSGSNWTDITDTVKQSSFNWSTTNLLLAGRNSLQFKVSDIAGNDGPVFMQDYVMNAIKPTTAVSNTKALQLRSQQYEYASFSTPTFGGQLTLEAWIYVNSVPTSNTSIIQLDNSTGNSNLVSLSFDASGKINFRVNDNGNQLFSGLSNDVMSANTWIHVAARVDSDQNYRLYINGTQQNDGGIVRGKPLPNVSRDSSFIGHSSTSGVADFNGLIRDVRVYSTARNPAADMQAAASATESNLQVYYPFNGSRDSGLTTGGTSATLNGSPVFVPQLSFSEDTGTSAHDFITNTATQYISGIVTGLPLDHNTGEKLWGSLDNGANWTDLSSSYTYSSLKWGGARLKSGNNTLLLKVTNAENWDGPVLTQTYTLDTTAPTLDLNSTTVGNDTTTNITSANAASFSTNSAILPNVATVSDISGVAKITLDFTESGNVLKTNDRLQVGTVVADLDLSVLSNSLAGTGTLGSLTGLDYTYDLTTHTLSIFKHDGSAMDAASIAAALSSLQFKNSTSTTGTRDFVLHLIDLAGNDASAHGQIVI